MKAILFTILLLVSSSVYAVILTSGDSGEDWARELAVEKCKEQNVGAVYICLGNVVKVVSTEVGAGSTFYKPEGKIVSCPVVAAPELGAECIQLTMPNYCPGDSVCGEAEEQVFPGHSDFDEQIEEVEEIKEEQEETEPEQPVEPEEETKEEQPEEPKEQKQPTEQKVKKTAKESPDLFASVLDSTALIIFGIGLVVVLILYGLFKKTVR